MIESSTSAKLNMSIQSRIDMNERIRKLAEQANCSIDGMGYGEGNMEKFAELIVREFCQKLEDDGMVEIAIEMKQHFGVEE